MRCRDLRSEWLLERGDKSLSDDDKLDGDSGGPAEAGERLRCAGELSLVGGIAIPPTLRRDIHSFQRVSAPSAATPDKKKSTQGAVWTKWECCSAQQGRSLLHDDGPLLNA